MAEQWIPAAQALQIVQVPPSYHDRMTICARARAGLIKSRARLFVRADERTANAELPASFWWAEGHEALEQDWVSGDFSTWIDRTYHWQAFDVSFALRDLLELIPVERRALTAQSLSVVGMNGWISAREARTFAFDRAKLNPMRAGDAIIDACQLGYISARAVLMRRTDGKQSDRWNLEEREWDVPQWYWDEFTGSGANSQDWERGIFAGLGSGPNGSCSITLTGVYFLSETLNVLLPRSVAAAPLATAPTTKPGGRPRKEWWDDLWCAVWGQVYRGDLTPKRQADIEKAMLDWATANGHEISESVIRPAARKMLAALESEGENSR